MEKFIKIQESELEKDNSLLEEVTKLLSNKKEYEKIYDKLISGLDDPLTDIDVLRLREEFDLNFPQIKKYLQEGYSKEISSFLEYIDSKPNKTKSFINEIQNQIDISLNSRNYVEEILDPENNVFNDMLLKYGFSDEESNYGKSQNIQNLEKSFNNIENVLTSVFQDNTEDYSSKYKNNIAYFANRYISMVENYLSKLSNIPGKELPKDGSISFYDEAYCIELNMEMSKTYSEINKILLQQKIDNLSSKIENLFFKEGGALSEGNSISLLETGDFKFQKPLKSTLVDYYHQILDNYEEGNAKNISKISNGLETIYDLLVYLTNYNGEKEYLNNDKTFENYISKIQKILSDLEK